MLRVLAPCVLHPGAFPLEVATRLASLVMHHAAKAPCGPGHAAGGGPGGGAGAGGAGAAGMDPAVVASWLLSVLFAPPLPALKGAAPSPAPAPAGAGGGVGAEGAGVGDAEWARHRAIADELCRAVQSWAPAGAALDAMSLQLEGLLRPGGLGVLRDGQRYALVRLAALAAEEAVEAGGARAGGRDGAGEGGGDGAPGGKRARTAQGGVQGAELPGPVEAALPRVAADLFASRGLADASAAVAAGGAGRGGAATPAGAAVLDLLCARPALLPAVIEAAVARALCRPAVEEEGPGAGGAPCQPCARTGLQAMAVLLQRVVQAPALRAALLGLRAEAEGAAGALREHARGDARVAGDGACAREVARLGQLVLDLHGGAAGR